MNDSMINPPITELLEKVDNRYRLVTVTSRRARQIIENQEVLLPEEEIEELGVEDVKDKPLTIAINEVNEGFVTYEDLDPAGGDEE